MVHLLHRLYGVDAPGYSRAPTLPSSPARWSGVALKYFSRDRAELGRHMFFCTSDNVKPDFVHNLLGFCSRKVTENEPQCTPVLEGIERVSEALQKN